jgi:hypothetical protein
MREIAVLFTDDLDRRSPASETVPLRFGDKTVEIDLSKQHYDELWALLAPYFKVGRPLSSGGLPVVAPPRKRPGRPTAERKAFLAGLRKYAELTGITLSPTTSGGYKYPQALEEEFARAIADGSYGLDGLPTGKAASGDEQ